LDGQHEVDSDFFAPIGDADVPQTDAVVNGQ